MKKGIVHLFVALFVLAVSIILIFAVLKFNEKASAVAQPTGQIHSDTSLVYGWGTSVQDTQITLTSTNVQGANGAQIDRVRYYLINPTLAPGHEWGNADWCSDPNCSASGYITYLIGDSSNSANNYQLFWNSSSLQPESSQKPRYLNSTNLLPGTYTIAIRVEDVNGQVTGNASQLTLTLSANNAPSPVPTPSPLPTPSPVPTPSPSPTVKTYQYKVTVANTEDATCCNEQNPSPVTSGTSGYKFSLKNNPDTRGYTGFVCSPDCSIIQNGLYPGLSRYAIQFWPNSKIGSVTLTPTGPVATPKLEFSITELNVGFGPGQTIKAFDLTSTGATSFDFYTPTNSLGIYLEPSRGTILPGQTKPIYLVASSGQPFGTYTGEIVLNFNNSMIYTGIKTKVEYSENDNDKDGFWNVYETALGTDINDGCSNDVNHAAWPPDINNDRAVTAADAQIVTNNIGKYNSRYDFDRDGFVTQKDTQIVNSHVGRTCQNGSVISTELNRQGKISEAVFEGDKKYGQATQIDNPQTMRGYRFWATSVVNLMQKSQIFTNLVNVVAQPVLTQIAYEAGTVDKGSLVGNVLLESGKTASHLIGNFTNQATYSTASVYY